MTQILAKQTSRLLHDEHMAALAVVERLDGVLKARRQGLPANVPDDYDLCRSLRELVGLVKTELPGHFEFEERELFPRLVAFGDGTMVDLLTEEHDVLTPAFDRLADDCAAILEGSYDPAGWDRFRVAAGEFIETLSSHIHKEEMGLVMAVETMLDDDTDQELALAYSATR